MLPIWMWGLLGAVAIAGVVIAMARKGGKPASSRAPAVPGETPPKGKSKDQDDELFGALIEAELGEPDLVIPAEAQFEMAKSFSPDQAEQEEQQVLQSFQADLDKIPPLPQVVIQILQVLSDPDSSARAVAQIAQNDPALVAAILRITNSAMYGLNRRITSMEEAVTYLGYSTVRALVVRLKLGELIPAPSNQRAYNHNDLWVHSLAVAIIADMLAREVPGIDRGYTSTLGLLHDIGKMAINSKFSEQAAKILGPDDPGEPPLQKFLARERKYFGTDHARLGAYLARRWNLPADLVEGIELHHKPAHPRVLALDEGHRKAMMLVYLANQLTKYCHVYCQNAEIGPVPQEVYEQLGFAPSLSKLLDNRVRGAMSRAIFFADSISKDSKTRPVSGVFSFKWGEEASAAADKFSSLERISSRIRVNGPFWPLVGQSDEDAEEEDAFSVVEYDVARMSDADRKELKIYTAVRFSVSPGDAASQRKLEEVHAEHLQALGLPAEVRLPALFMVRRAVEAMCAHGEEADTVELYQAVRQRRFLLGFRSPALAFARRLGSDAKTELGQALLASETVNVLNLNWYAAVDASPEGDTVLFITAPVPGLK